MKKYTFDEIVESQDFCHDEEFVLLEDVKTNNEKALVAIYKLAEVVSDHSDMGKANIYIETIKAALT